MSTSAAASPSAPRARWPLLPIVLTLALLALIAVGLGIGRAPATAAPAGWYTATATTGPFEATIDTAGVLEAALSAEVRFAQEGRVAEILVHLGDTVRAGAPLARLDDADMKLRLEQAQVDLQQARVDLSQAQASATPDQIAAAQARVRQAQGQYAQAAGRVTPADLAAAQATLERARARLARLQAGASSVEQARADEALRRAQDALAQARVDLSAAKERARLDVESRANALRNAQDEFSRIYWENRQQESRPGGLSQQRRNQEAAADRAVQDATAALQNAQLAYDQARQTEITTLQTREAELAAAQAERDRVARGPLREELIEAEAEVRRAEAALAQLQGSSRQGELAALQAGVAAAQVELDRLSAAPAAGPLLRAEAAVARAEIGVRQAELALERATLTAPFDGTIVRVQMRVGESPGQNSFIAIVNPTQLLISADVDEFDVAILKPRQPVRVRIDAIPDQEYTGTVSAIASAATRGGNGSNTYRVEIVLDRAPGGARPGMGAALRVVTERLDQALLVPRQAILRDGATSYVLVPGAETDASAGTPPGTRRPVTVGLGDDQFVIITAGLAPGEQVWVQDVSAEVAQ